MSNANPKERRADSNAEKANTLNTKNLVKHDKWRMITELRIICALKSCKVIGGNYPIEFTNSVKPLFRNYQRGYLSSPSKLNLKCSATLRASKQVMKNDLY